ncbi:translesion DNA synthesis-associated protein ImuA [Pseudorhodoferax soli]|uniref:Protein ImuA n=1 Tax=Pseudorhodoferax soli TaxID=545864 RepID=A0A368XAW9_9BURK|nr:translesion DNA synthesis-associated protein ImuA [Pseudorhodoferax soli]RCW65113.1 protein ImuA [Pseudorhodoferax soli]
MSAVPAFSPPVAANDVGAVRQVALSPRVAEAVWRGTELEHRTTAVRSTGWAELDAELPGGGWPEQSVVEILTTQPATLEWRLLAPALKSVTASGGNVVLVGPPRLPHVPGLQQVGLSERHIIWIEAEAPAQRLWTAEQLIKSHAAGAIIAWLPKARAEQIRRLQVCAQGCEGLVFLCRPDAARHESSAAPLRVHASVGVDWELHVQVLKRRGPTHERPLALASLPGGLASVLTPRVLRPSLLLPSEAIDAVDSAAATARSRRHATH